MNLQERFEQYGNSEYIKFERVKNKRSQRPDLCGVKWDWDSDGLIMLV